MFIGYFPEPNPRYSCLVMLEDPRGGVYYASQVAAPVFRDIAEQTMAIKEFRRVAAVATTPPGKDSPGSANLARQGTGAGGSWDRVKVNEVKDLLGSDAASAVWALESKGYRVSLQGSGKVRQCMGLGESTSTEYRGIPAAKPGQRVMLLLGT